MADIILAEMGGNGWLVCGEQYIDDLLANTLPPHLTIEVIPCESKSEAYALWQQYEGGEDNNMWMIHPGIVRRVLGLVEMPGATFASLSIALDAEAVRAMEMVASQLGREPHRILVLVQFAVDPPPPMAADIARLRMTLLQSRFAELGVEPARITTETRPASTEAQSDRIEFHVKDPA